MPPVVAGGGCCTVKVSRTQRAELEGMARCFCGYVVRRGLLAANPCDAPELSVRSETGVVVAAFTASDIDALLAAAAAPPPSNVRSAWPARGVPLAVIRQLLGHT